MYDRLDMKNYPRHISTADSVLMWYVVRRRNWVSTRGLTLFQVCDWLQLER